MQMDGHLNVIKNVKLLGNLRDLTDYISKTDWLIIIDEEIAQEAIRRHMMDEMKKSSNYFLLITRGILYTQTNVRALLELKDSKLSPINGTRLFDTVYTFKLKDSNVKADNSRLKYLITEDTASGKIFWDRLFPNVTLVTLINTGNSGIYKSIVDFQSKNKSDLIMIALDYDEGATTMNEIVNRGAIDKSRIVFIPLESFEEVICNSEFILSKFPEMRDEVINYKDYIDCSYKHTGKYFSHLLHKYVKVKSPIIKDSKHNITKFYSKGMKNFEQCFINECCEFNSEDCKLYFEGDKKKAMLSNKFEFLQGLL